ncbi:uncharacterized protein K460DRAFT_412449 [Cucurbitaria berberidis CBS 394.84]|uniref:Uncharacterized protein n=1 Tax=Cucurbitaria berberidis CBS 394.84 TaxID=1168544 RepID=A0A9P4GS44_9PLEO|nr:uncharacterized protein K460DRAFT_412449 [Cucurbitaria berberidis CBS 394.84]KAF1850802.1 hypothetical protein K460DRAFT_412449 [Cucurbitaria berberidis CBS 394.84]
MSNSTIGHSDCANSDSRRYLPAKCVPNPNKLVKAISEAVGKGNFRIEMQHNIYAIVLYQDADTNWEKLLKSPEMNRGRRG